MANLELIMRGYHLTTARILYHMPDHYDLLQLYLWQDYDLIPEFPALKKFLTFWQEKLDGPLHSVTICTSNIIYPDKFVFVDREFDIN